MSASHSTTSRTPQDIEHNAFLAYDHHARSHAWQWATGVAIIILGFAIGDFLMLTPEHTSADTGVVIAGLDKLVGLMTKEIVHLPEVNAHPESFITEIVFTLIGIVIVRNVSEDAQDFRKAFRTIEDYYTPQQKRSSALAWLFYSLLGIAIIVVAGIFLWSSSDHMPRAAASGILLTAIAIGVWFMVYGERLGIRTDIFLANFQALRLVNVYELGKSESDERLEAQLGQKRLSDISTSLRRLALTFGILAALAMYFLPSMHTRFFWVPLVLIALVMFIIRWIILRIARSRYGTLFDHHE